jgi:hypothetical protein
MESASGGRGRVLDAPYISATTEEAASGAMRL